MSPKVLNALASVYMQELIREGKPPIAPGPKRPRGDIFFPSSGAEKLNDSSLDDTALVVCGDILAPVDKQHRLAPDCAPTDLVYVPGTGHQLRREAAAALAELFAAAVREGYSLMVVSAYRSYATQVAVFNNWARTLGPAEAQRISARPGHSEHQIGTTADITATRVGTNGGFVGTPEAAWVANEGWRYGFIVSYPQGKEAITGYSYEPWHVRYLGKETAEKIHKSGLTTHEFLVAASEPHTATGADFVAFGATAPRGATVLPPYALRPGHRTTYSTQQLVEGSRILPKGSRVQVLEEAMNAASEIHGQPVLQRILGGGPAISVVKAEPELYYRIRYTGPSFNWNRTQVVTGEVNGWVKASSLVVRMQFGKSRVTTGAATASAVSSAPEFVRGSDTLYARVQDLIQRGFPAATVTFFYNQYEAAVRKEGGTPLPKPAYVAPARVGPKMLRGTHRAQQIESLSQPVLWGECTGGATHGLVGCHVLPPWVVDNPPESYETSILVPGSRLIPYGSRFQILEDVDVSHNPGFSDFYGQGNVSKAYRIYYDGPSRAGDDRRVGVYPLHDPVRGWVRTDWVARV